MARFRRALYKLEWVERSSVKDITSFDQWLKAHMVYAAIYIDAHPERAGKLVKYESVIHDCSMRYDWDAVLLYDYHFRQSMAEDPSCSWAETDTELYTSIFTDQGLGKNRGWGTLRQKSKLPCNGLNQGKCPYKNSKFTHKCSKCQKFGHPATQCRGSEPQGQQQPHQNNRQPQTRQPPAASVSQISTVF